jgi:hypothetical protein
VRDSTEVSPKTDAAILRIYGAQRKASGIREVHGWRDWLAQWTDGATPHRLLAIGASRRIGALARHASEKAAGSLEQRRVTDSARVA